MTLLRPASPDVYRVCTARRALLVPLGQQGKQHFPLGAVVLHVADVIEYQAFNKIEPAQLARQPEIVLGRNWTVRPWRIDSHQRVSWTTRGGSTNNDYGVDPIAVDSESSATPTFIVAY